MLYMLMNNLSSHVVRKPAYCNFSTTILGISKERMSYIEEKIYLNASRTRIYQIKYYF